MQPECPAQAIHYDEMFSNVDGRIIREPRLRLACILAVNDFIPENSGTVIYPGSHTWPMARGLDADRDQHFALNMKAGPSLAMWTGAMHLPRWCAPERVQQIAK